MAPFDGPVYSNTGEKVVGMFDVASLLQSPELLRQRYTLFAQMRQFQPIIYIPDYQLWLLFKYDDVRTVISDYENYSSDFRRFGTTLDEDAFQAMAQRQFNSGNTLLMT